MKFLKDIFKKQKPLSDRVGIVLRQKKTGRKCLVETEGGITWLDTNEFQIDWDYVMGESKLSKINARNFEEIY